MNRQKQIEEKIVSLAVNIERDQIILEKYRAELAKIKREEKRDQDLRKLLNSIVRDQKIWTDLV